METDQYGFADEYGTPSLELDKQGVSTVFIITAVLVEPRALTEARENAESIRKRYFGSGEMKSSSVGSNDRKRMKILDEFRLIPFHWRAIIIDKAAINKNSGLIYKRSFLKYTSRKLYRQLYASYPRLALRVDNHGGEDFKKEFKKYIQGQSQLELFSQKADFDFADSKDEPLLQVADMISGTLARYYEPEKLSENWQEMIRLLKPSLYEVVGWPAACFSIYNKLTEDATHDEKIMHHCMNLAARFITENINAEDETLKQQLEVVLCLYNHAKLINSSAYVPRGRLLKILKNKKLETTSRKLSAKIIGKLRDKGLIIASSLKGGYKIPTCHSDLNQFVEMKDSIIRPMLNRLRRARVGILEATGSELDILKSVEYLRTLIESLPRRDTDPMPNGTNNLSD